MDILMILEIEEMIENVRSRLNVLVSCVDCDLVQFETRYSLSRSFWKK